jgi:hypothetical protein
VKVVNHSGAAAYREEFAKEDDTFGAIEYVEGERMDAKRGIPPSSLTGNKHPATTDFGPPSIKESLVLAVVED